MNLTDPAVTFPLMFGGLATAVVALVAIASICRRKASVMTFAFGAALLFTVMWLIAMPVLDVEWSRGLGVAMWVGVLVVPQALATGAWLVWGRRYSSLCEAVAGAFILQILPAAFLTLFLSCIAHSNCP